MKNSKNITFNKNETTLPVKVVNAVTRGVKCEAEVQIFGQDASDFVRICKRKYFLYDDVFFFFYLTILAKLMNNKSLLFFFLFIQHTVLVNNNDEYIT